MNFRNVALTLTLLLLAAAGVFGWFKFIAHPTPATCAYCLRPLYANLEVTAEIDGKRAEVCCPRCAITEANQRHKHLRLIAVHDYSTGQSIPPETAWYVEGSRVSACHHDAMHMDEMKGTQEIAFDRCSPGTLTFAAKQQADDFALANGGTVLSFVQLMTEAQFQ